MSRVVFIGWTASGNVNPTLSLVNELVKRGEEVIYIAGDNCRHRIEAAGCTYLKNGCLSLLFKSSKPNLSKKASKISEGEFLENVSKYYGSLQYLYVLLDKVKRFIIGLKPDYIIHDSGIGFIKYVCRDLNIPCISSVSLFALNREMFLRSPALFSDLYSVQLESNVEVVVKAVDQIAEDCSIEHRYYHDFFDNYVSKENLNIVYTSMEFQPHLDLLDNSFHFSGNSLELRKILESKRNYSFSRARKMILISFGSFLSSSQTNVDIYKSFINYFRNYPATFVLNIGSISKEEFDQIPDNFILENGISQLELLELVDLFITHGGMNSVSEAIQLNTPMIVLPQMTDQFVVAEQVEKVGIGLNYRTYNIDFCKIEYLISKILSDKSYQENVRYMAETYRATGEEKTAVDKIFDYVGKR